LNVDAWVRVEELVLPPALGKVVGDNRVDKKRRPLQIDASASFFFLDRAASGIGARASPLGTVLKRRLHRRHLNDEIGDFAEPLRRVGMRRPVPRGPIRFANAPFRPW